MTIYLGKLGGGGGHFLSFPVFLHTLIENPVFLSFANTAIVLAGIRKRLFVSPDPGNDISSEQRAAVERRVANPSIDYMV